jgi:phosphatidate phosphatase LPIN
LTILLSQTPIAEPDFLDLDAVPSQDTTATGSVSATPPPAPLIDLPSADTPLVAHDNLPDASTIPETPSEVLQPSSLLVRSTGLGTELAATAGRALKEEEKGHVGQITAAQNITKRRLAPHLPSIKVGNEDQGDEALHGVSTEGVQAPSVAYKNDVVLDMEGYHSRERSDRTVTGGEIDIETVADGVPHEVKKQ